MTLPFERKLFRVKQEFCLTTWKTASSQQAQLSVCRHFFYSRRRHSVQLSARRHRPFERRCHFSLQLSRFQAFAVFVCAIASWVYHSPALVASISVMAIFCMSSRGSP